MILLGLPHPLNGVLPSTMLTMLGALFLVAELQIILLGAIATRDKKYLWPYLPTLHFYFPLGTLAIYKALWEMVHRPFYWDKTAHGHSLGHSRRADAPTDPGSAPHQA